MARDIKLIQDSDTGLYDIDFSNGDFDTTDGLDTAITMSIFNEKRATKTQVPEPSLRRGHFSNEFSDVEGYEVGSRQWLYTEQAKNSESNLSLLQSSIRDGLQWMIDDDIISNLEVTASKAGSKIDLEINLEGKTKDDAIHYNAFINTFN